MKRLLAAVTIAGGLTGGAVAIPSVLTAQPAGAAAPSIVRFVMHSQDCLGVGVLAFNPAHWNSDFNPSFVASTFRTTCGNPTSVTAGAVFGTGPP